MITPYKNGISSECNSCVRVLLCVILCASLIMVVHTQNYCNALRCFSSALPYCYGHSIALA